VAQTTTATPAYKPVSDVLVDVAGLKTYFFTDDGVVKAVDGVDFQIKKGETLGVVGESGCGKSVTALSILRLIANPPGRIVEGSITYSGRDLTRISERDMRKVRGNDISMIFQEPMTSLNPVYTVGDQIAEAITLHQGKTRREAMQLAAEMLDLVGIPVPQKRIHEYPHQMSGGMRQRVMIAMALSCNPGLLIADEPTTALDVTIQAQILELMKKLKEDIGMSILLITHDLGVVAEMAERVSVMYAGRVVEAGTATQIYKSPRHPYTRGLLNSVPRVDKAAEKQQRLTAIEGVVPNPLYLPSGCAFHPRCPYVKEECKQAIPPLEETGDGQLVRCIRWREI
jgi:oligopeptide/dipeptide ABC transporter ATP-binding protein